MMVINTKIEVEAVEFNDYRNLRISRSISDYNSSSRFVALFDNPFGRHNDDFSVGNEIQIFADQDAAATTLLFTGVIEKIKFKGKENTQTVELSGRDLALRLLDITVEPSVFTDSEVSTIATNIVQNNVPDLTVTSIDVTTTTLERITFNHTTVFNALKQLAEVSGFYFYVDEDKDVHFEELETTSSGIVLDNTNMMKSRFETTREGMANTIWVYGDRTLAGFEEINTLDGSAWGGAPGSIYILLSKPRNTHIEYLGNPLTGGVLNLTNEVISGTDYLVNFYDKEIVFVSGTDIGYSSIPISGGSIFSRYDRDVPIVKFAEDLSSIDQFGKKVKIINDPTIKDPQTAQDILDAMLDRSVNPFKGVEVEINGWETLVPGNTIQVILDDFGLNEVVGILDITYTFDKNTQQSENVIKVRLDRKIQDLTDQFADLKRRLDLLEGIDREESDIITRQARGTGSALIVGSSWYIQTNWMGSSFILGGMATGSVDGVGGIVLGLLGSDTGSVSFLGDSRSSLSIIASGGYF